MIKVKNVFFEPGHNEFTYRNGSKMIKIKDEVIFREFNDFNIKVACKLSYKLLRHPELKGHQLEYDNNKIDMTLNQRINYINKYGDDDDDIVIGIHANYSSNPTIGGVDLFYCSNAGKKLIELYRKHSNNNLIPYRSTIKCIYDTWTEFGLILNTKPPAMYLEAGFFSNAYDRNQLRSEKYQEQVAESLYKMILDYYNIKSVKLVFNDEYKQCIDVLYKNGIITGLDYWKNDTITKKEVDYVQLIKNMVRYINLKN
jgi:N-acetylmuramoyl-L-alanine amidase